MNGDSFCDVNLSVFWAWHRARNAECTLLLTKVPDTERYGRVHIDNNGLVLGFDEKGNKGEPGWINAGVYLFNRRFVLSILEGGVVSLEREIFPAWISRGLYGYRSEGRFLDIGTPEAYNTAEQFFAPETLA